MDLKGEKIKDVTKKLKWDRNFKRYESPEFDKGHF